MPRRGRRHPDPRAARGASPGRSRCDCPATSSRDVGRIRTASGRLPLEERGGGHRSRLTAASRPAVRRAGLAAVSAARRINPPGIPGGAREDPWRRVASQRRRARQEREARERPVCIRPGSAFHDGQARRRTRDNLIAGIVGGVLILAIVAGQAAYFMVGPAPRPDAVRDADRHRDPRRRAPSPTATRRRPPTPTPTADAHALTRAPTSSPPSAERRRARTRLGSRPSPTGGESRDEVHPVTAAAESTPESRHRDHAEPPERPKPAESSPEARASSPDASAEARRERCPPRRAAARSSRRRRSRRADADGARSPRSSPRRRPKPEPAASPSRAEPEPDVEPEPSRA